MTEHYLNQQNVTLSGRHTQSSETLRATSPLLLSTLRRSQTPLELSNVLSDSARAFSGAPSRIGKFWSFCDLSAHLRETSTEAETAAQLSGKLDVIFTQQWCLHNRKAFSLIIIISLLQSQDWLHYNMACTIEVSLYIYLRSIWPQMVLQHDWRSTRPHALRQHLEMDYLEAVPLKPWI